MKTRNLKLEPKDMFDSIVSKTSLDTDCVYDLIEKFGLVCNDDIQEVGMHSPHIVHVVTNKNDDYFIGLNRLNYVQFIREKAIDGNLIYVDI